MIVLTNTLGGTNLFPTDVDIRFPRRNYTNDSANVTNLISMLASDWITPEFAYQHASMSADPHRDYLLAKAWHESVEAKEVSELENANNEEPQTSVATAHDETSSIMS